MIDTAGVPVLEDVMTRNVHIVSPSTTVLSAARVISDNHVGALPVVDEAGKVVGIVSAGQLIDRLAGRRRTEATVADVMSPAPLTVAAATTVRAAVRLVQTHRLRHLVVVDADGRLRGVVSRGDILRLLLD